MSTSQRVSTPIKPNQKPQMSTPKTTSSLSSQTPDKPASQPQSRSRRSMAMSINDVRRSARIIRSKQGTPRVENERIRSAKKQILMPESPVKKPRSVNCDVADKLPEKYEKLRELFDSMDSSIQLLRLKGKKTSFANIRSQVECLTGSSFTDAHLAQMKFILPEAIELQKVLAFNELTYRMEPELHVSLNMEFLKDGEGFKSEILNMPLRKLFRSRLMEFVKSHPEGDEVPEEALPVPSSHSKHKQQSELIRPHVSHDTPIETVTNEQLVAASHLPRTFRRRFIQKLSGKETKKSLHNESESSVQSVPSGTSFNKASSFEDTRITVPSPAKAALEKADAEDLLAPNTLTTYLESLNSPITPRKEIDYIKSKDHSPSEVICNQSTPAKLALTPARLMSMTPSVNPSKRSGISTDDDSMSSTNKLVRRPPRNRPLKFEDDLDDLLPADLLQSIREKEKKSKEELDPAISQAKRRKQMIASLPKLVNKIRYLFQSLSRSVITKGELMQKLVASHLDISERSEVEEQLDLLLEIVPDWISEKMSSSGDLLLVINKISNLDSVRMRLEQAK